MKVAKSPTIYEKFPQKYGNLKKNSPKNPTVYPSKDCCSPFPKINILKKINLLLIIEKNLQGTQKSRNKTKTTWNFRNFSTNCLYDYSTHKLNNWKYFNQNQIWNFDSDTDIVLIKFTQIFHQTEILKSLCPKFPKDHFFFFFSTYHLATLLPCPVPSSLLVRFFAEFIIYFSHFKLIFFMPSWSENLSILIETSAISVILYY